MSRAVIPFLLLKVAVLLLITYVPEIVLVVPWMFAKRRDACTSRLGGSILTRGIDHLRAQQVVPHFAQSEVCDRTVGDHRGSSGKIGLRTRLKAGMPQSDVHTPTPAQSTLAFVMCLKPARQRKGFASEFLEGLLSYKWQLSRGADNYVPYQELRAVPGTARRRS